MWIVLDNTGLVVCESNSYGLAIRARDWFAAKGIICFVRKV